LAAELVDGSVLAGQNEISHPSTSSLPQEVNKGMWDVLPSPVRRIFYLSAEGDRQEHEVAPPPNPRMLHEVEKADAIVYGMGSLYTSICTSLVLRGVGEAVADVSCPKILLLNGSLDRETSTCQAHPGPMRASDVVLAITDALNRRGAFARAGQLDNSPATYVTTVLVPSGGEVEVDEEELLKLGIQNVISVESERGADGLPLYDPEGLVAAIGSITMQGKR